MGIEGMHANSNRGTAQPESREQRRKRLHREAAEDVKHYAAALRDAKERYRAYDASMAEMQQPQGQIEEERSSDEVDAADQSVSLTQNT
jgi:hypothetical protein